ncbi:hypothetical protein CAEBREN_11603 [Caenorhabditis brenneri]|uniref:MYST-type HAT domain-containing protein n=1 Tax=Caenorhabditis brenneri TaxID=135651 RepID=G0NKI2_CAEBE|nr:hypothetical protein CAEBREN_11603 [Caenorhabditis brenneri]
MGFLFNNKNYYSEFRLLYHILAVKINFKHLPLRPQPRSPVRPQSSSAFSEDEDEEDNRMGVRKPLQMKEGLGEFKCGGCDDCRLSEEYKSMPLIIDASSFQISPDARRIFEKAKKRKEAMEETNFWDTDLFLFYVITHIDVVGCHYAGFFSKEKNELSTNNVNCNFV